MSINNKEGMHALTYCVCKFDSDYRRLQASFGKLAKATSTLLAGMHNDDFCLDKLKFIVEALELEIRQIGFILELEPLPMFIHLECIYAQEANRETSQEEGRIES